MAQALRMENRPAAAEVRAAEEMILRVETTGYGGVPVRVAIPGEALSSIGRGDLPVEMKMKIRAPGYGWRVVGTRVSPGETRPVRLTVPGYGSTPLRMTFLVGKR